MSNHDILRPIAEMFGIPFQHLPIPPKDQGGKRAQELQVEAILEENEIDLVVMAKYMQILTKVRCYAMVLNTYRSLLNSSRDRNSAINSGARQSTSTTRHYLHFQARDLITGLMNEEAR